MTMKIYCCQTNIVWENKPASHVRTLALLSGAVIPGGSLVILPEMFSTGFSMNVTAIAEGRGESTEAFLARTAKEFGIYLLGGVVTAGKDGRGRNEAVVYSPAGAEIARYCKMQPFTLGGEAEHYAAGERLITFEWQGFVVAPFICYDLRFPELFRAAARRGATLFPVIANWPVARASHWVTLLQARAIENQAYVAGANRVGNDPKLEYPGRSLIVHPGGEVLADAGNQETVISAEISPGEVTDYRKRLPFLQDMRPEFAKAFGG
jgi:predicted amidohydrolase